MEPIAKANILIVDDEPKNLLAFGEILDALHQNVITAASGEEALRHVLAHEFAVILLDVHMKGMDGFETADIIRQRLKTRHTPIIFVSAVQTATGHVYRGYSVGAVDYIFKPVEPAVLRSKVAVFVEMYLTGQQMRRQAEELREHERREHALALAEQKLHLEAETYRMREELLRKEIEAAGARAAQELAQTRALLLADLEARNAELRTKNGELEAFSYTVSHDLRAPLRAMQGFAQVLIQDYADKLDAPGQEFLQRIAAAAGRMDALIRDILAYSRMSRGELVFESMPLGDLMTESVDRLSDEIRQRQAQVVSTIDPALPEVLCHQETAIMVLTNLLSNAIKFVPSSVRPVVRIHATAHDALVRLWMEDNGIGIAPEHYDRIFRVFERLHGDGTYPGTGIGLAIVRRGMERMGGQVGLESAVGQGSKFWIDLPMAHPPAVSRDAATADTSVAARAEGAVLEDHTHV